MMMNRKIQHNIDSLVQDLMEKQAEDGSWRFCFESGPMTDAYLIIVLNMLEMNEEELIDRLAKRLLSMQEEQGTWKLFEDEEEGNLSATVEAYTGLLFAGMHTSTKKMQLAERFIIRQGGLGKVHISTKFMLALNNLYPWPKFFPLPPWLMILPKFLPVSFHSYSSYARLHFAPIMIAAKRRIALVNSKALDLSHLFAPYSEKAVRLKAQHVSFANMRKETNIFSSGLNKWALKNAESYVLQRIETDGTLFSYASSTFFLIYALLALGYRKNSPLIKQAVQGLKMHLFPIHDQLHLQNSPSTIWDTALISYALIESGLDQKNVLLQQAAKYLLKHQLSIMEEGNRYVPSVRLGAWGFSESNSLHPDVDDTQAALRAIYPFISESKRYRQVWLQGVNWLLAMQNKDGGWGGFERNKYNKMITLLPIQSIKDTGIDPSVADITGRVLEFLGSYVQLTVDHPRVKTAVKWLLKHQEANGSWAGRWGVSYIYGTWAALTGLRAVGVSTEHQAIRRATNWLLSIQLEHGGWGESCQSDTVKDYVPLAYPTPSQTSWALDALIAVYSQSIPAIDKGMAFLQNWKFPKKALTYPTGAGLPGQFYINYHSYNYIFPLLALSHYQNKYGSGKGGDICDLS